uniref:Insulin-like growth factor 2 receptor n=1 Tax=Panagrellus redivivus TaxID=6233 RepID=A0A7E4VD04_PANRE
MKLLPENPFNKGYRQAVQYHAMAPAPRLTLIWLTGLVIAIVVNAVNGGYVDKNGKPAPKPCIEGKEYFNSLFVYECKQRKFVLSGCKMNNNQYKMNEIRDFNNLRMQFCVKTGRTIRSGVTGCVTDDGLFLNSSATVTQKNGVQFTCIQEKNTFRFKKLKVNVPKVVTITKKQCKLNEEKILGDRYLVKCRKTETGARKFELHQCLADIGQRETAFPVNESYHHYMDKEKTWGFVFKCETYENKFSFRPVACLLKSVEIAEGQTHKDGRRSVMCYRDASNKLKLRSAFESEVKTKTCKKTKTYNRGNLRIKCVSGKLPEAISCVSNNGTHLIAIGETYKIVGAFKYVCENASNGLVFKKVACLDLKGREINENNVANAPDGSQIRCVRNNSTGDLDRIFISGQNIPCKPGSEPIVLNNLQYVCNSKTHYYNAEACVSFAKDPQIIPLGKSYDTKWYRYLCERKNNDIVFHAVNCFDDVKNEIAPGQENKSGKMLYKCTIKNEFDLSLVIAEAGGCTNPVNQKHLSSGSVMRKSRFIGQLNYKIAFKCVKDQSAEASYKWEANGILIGDKNYPANATSFEIEGQEYKIVQIGGNDIRVVEAQDYETNCYVHKNTYKNNETWISQNGESVFQCVKGHAVKINCRLQKEELFVLQLEQVTYIGKVPYYCSDDELVELPFDGCIFKKNEYKWNDEFPIEHTVFKCVLSQQNGMYVSAVQAVGCVHNGKKLAINDYVMESGKYLVCNEIVGLTEMKIATAEEVACIIKTQTIDCSGSGAQVDASAGSGEARAIADPLGQGVDAADYHFNDTDVLITTDDDDDIYVTLYPPTNGRIQTGCVNGTKVNNGHVIYVCYQNKMVYYGCFVNGREHREGEIVDRKNLRSKFCVKKGNRIISSVIGRLFSLPYVVARVMF